MTIGPQQLTVAEGNDTMNSTLQLCVFLGGITENLQREVTVNITATESTATGIHVIATCVPELALRT